MIPIYNWEKNVNPNSKVLGLAGNGAFWLCVNDMTAKGRREWPGITMNILRNYRSRTEKLISVLW